MPVTLIFGPSASYNLLSVALPGLFCYAMYRVARLWLPSQTGAIAAGAFFGLSSMLVWRSWYHLNLALGELFLPIALEAAVRLTRRPGWRQAVILGVVLAAAVLTDQEIAVLVIIVAVLTLAAWLARPPVVARPSWRPPGWPRWSPWCWPARSSSPSPAGSRSGGIAPRRAACRPPTGTTPARCRTCSRPSPRIAQLRAGQPRVHLPRPAHRRGPDVRPGAHRARGGRAGCVLAPGERLAAGAAAGSPVPRWRSARCCGSAATC